MQEREEWWTRRSVNKEVGGGAGPCKLIGGELVPSSIDVYIVMEFGEEGDLFNLRCFALSLLNSPSSALEIVDKIPANT